MCRIYSSLAALSSVHWSVITIINKQLQRSNCGTSTQPEGQGSIKCFCFSVLIWLLYPLMGEYVTIFLGRSTKHVLALNRNWLCGCLRSCLLQLKGSLCYGWPMRGGTWKNHNKGHCCGFKKPDFIKSEDPSQADLKDSDSPLMLPIVF